MPNIEELQAGLAEACWIYRDRRTNVCQLEILSLEDQRADLKGEVLDRATLDGVLQALGERFEHLAWDARQVRFLRDGHPVYLSVATNLTDLHAAATFDSELVSQMLAGVAVEVLREEGRWVFIRQMDGYLGWTYRPYLTEFTAPEFTHWIAEPLSLLREQPGLTAPLVSRLLGGTGVSPAAWDEDWACIRLLNGLEGWIPAAHLRSIDRLPRGEGERRRQMVYDAMTFTGVPYLWGGSSANGIDCSGLAQIIYRLAGMTIPRDADMQYYAGRPVEPPYQPGDLVFFSGDDDNPQHITHVTISLGGWRIVHSSRSRNGVYVDDIQAVPHLRDCVFGACTYL